MPESSSEHPLIVAMQRGHLMRTGHILVATLEPHDTLPGCRKIVRHCCKGVGE